MAEIAEKIKQSINSSQYVLVGIGSEWRKEQDKGIAAAYEALHQLIKDKDYFVVTTVTDAEIFHSSLDASRITAPCGNVTWQQCEDACTKDIWEPGEVISGICPHCGKLLIPNTIESPNYIEDGYMRQWKVYTAWLQKTINRDLTILELGVGFETPTVIRWPFEKMAFFNKKSHFCRVNKKFPQVTEELKETAASIEENSVIFLREL